MNQVDEKNENESTQQTDPIQHNGDNQASTAPSKPGEKATQTGKTQKIEQEKHFASSLKEMFVHVTEKGEQMVKTGAAAVGDFTVQAAHQAKLKLEIHNLQSNLEKRFKEAGEKLWQLKKRGELDKMEEAFADPFKQMADIEASLRLKEADAEGKAEPEPEKEQD